MNVTILLLVTILVIYLTQKYFSKNNANPADSTVKSEIYRKLNSKRSNQWQLELENHNIYVVDQNTWNKAKMSPKDVILFMNLA